MPKYFILKYIIKLTVNGIMELKIIILKELLQENPATLSKTQNKL